MCTVHMTNRRIELKKRDAIEYGRASRLHLGRVIRKRGMEHSWLGRCCAGKDGEFVADAEPHVIQQCQAWEKSESMGKCRDINHKACGQSCQR